MVNDALFPPDAKIGDVDPRIRVLHVVEAFGGGVQTALSQYLENSEFAAHKIVARTRPGHAVGVLEDADLEVFDGNLAQFANFSNKVIKKFEPHIVHLHSSYSSLLRVLPMCASRRLVYSPHCFAFERADKNSLQRTFYKRVEEFLHRIRPAEIAAVSPYEVELATTALKARDVTLLPNVIRGQDNPHQASAKDQTAWTRRVVGVGRITPQKSPDFFAAVAQRLSGRGIEFVWIGDGDPSLRELLERAGVDVLGWQTNSTTKQIVRSADLYLHTASWEGAPIAPLEATEVGVPVIARDIAALQGLGYFTAGKTVECVSDAVEKFFRSTEFAAEVIRTDRARATKYCPSFQRAALRRLYSIRSETVGVL
ncbi:glycosyltransferase [Rhodococcus sp. M8]|nr:hypothetical protein BKE56_001345 [Rhodococcus sp. M8]QPG47455.1 glycosyltransferase [Rhodococcus sp. M8]